ncbi:MAG: hypothetical protein ACP5NK_07230 [Thermoplasmata archaeon]
MKSQRIALTAGVLYTIVIIVALTFAIRASNNMIQTTIPLLARYDLSYSQLLVGGACGIAVGFRTGFITSQQRHQGPVS